MATQVTDLALAERIAAAVSRAPGHLAVLLDESFVVQWASETSTAVVGWRPEELVGRCVLELVHPDDLEIALAGMALHAGSAEEYRHFDPSWRPETVDARLQAADGGWVRIEVSLMNLLGDPEVRGLLALGRRSHDRTDLGRAIDLLGQGAPLTEVLPVVARLIDCTFDGCRAQVLFWDGTGEHVLAAADGEPLPDLPADLVAAVRATGQPQTSSSLPDGHPFRGVWVIPVSTPGRSDVIGCVTIWSGLAVNRLMGPQQPVYQALRLAALAIADHHSKEALRFEATHDPLTALFNRAGFNQEVARGDAAEGCALLYVDLDDFKPVNDRLGHEAGDAVLVEVARRIGVAVRSGDYAARIGGDEFAVMCPGMVDEDDAIALARRLIEIVSLPMTIGGVPVSVSASVGVAFAPRRGDRTTLLRRADEAMYEAKAAGKGHVVVAQAGRLS